MCALLLISPALQAQQVTPAPGGSTAPGAIQTQAPAGSLPAQPAPNNQRPASNVPPATTVGTPSSETPGWLGDRANTWHSSLTRSYSPYSVPQISLSNSSRLDQLIRAGKIYLSLQDAIALALENNLDIELQRYGPQIAQTDLLRAQAGGLLRGVPAAIAAGPTSAANLQTGSGASTGIGALRDTSAAGTGGSIITSTGTVVPVYDEGFFFNYTWGHRTLTQANSFSTGTPALVFNSGNVNVGFQKAFQSGTTVVVGLATTSQNSNNLRAEINPVNNGSMNIQVTQRLLQGFSIAANTRYIRVAKNDIKVADLVFRQQVMTTVASIVNLYSDLVSFTENVKVRRQALALSEKLYSDNKKQVEIGTLAPIEIVRAEAEVARSQQDLTGAETQLLQQETIIKNALSRNGISNPQLSEARIVPTDSLRMPDVEQIQPIQDLVDLAIKNRPEIEQTDINIRNARIQLSGSRSQLLPSLDLVATAQNNGLAGSVNGLPLPPDLPFRNANPSFLGGYGDVFGQIFSRNYPDYSVGFQLNVPIRNRSAQSDYVRDQLTLRQSELRQRQQINQVRVDVQNAIIGLQQARAQYQAALKGRVLQEQTLDAEQKKYALGASTIFFVIQAQRDLSQAQASEVQALSTYNRARVNLDLATGTTLQTYDISVDEAVKGRISRAPSALPALEQAPATR